MMSKTQEKEMFQGFIDSAPDGYVKDILTGIQYQVIQAINSDFGFIQYQEIEKLASEKAALQESIKGLEAKEKNLNYNLHALEMSQAKAISRIRDEVSNINYAINKFQK